MDPFLLNSEPMMVGKTKKKLKIMTLKSLSLNFWKKLAEDKTPYRKFLFYFKQENDEFSTILKIVKFHITDTLQYRTQSSTVQSGHNLGQSISDKTDVKNI